MHTWLMERTMGAKRASLQKEACSYGLAEKGMRLWSCRKNNATVERTMVAERIM